MSWRDKLFGGKQGEQEQKNLPLSTAANANAKLEKQVYSDDWRAISERKLNATSKNANLIKTVIERIGAIEGVDLKYSEKVVNQDVILSLTTSSKQFEISIGGKDFALSSLYTVSGHEGRGSYSEPSYDGKCYTPKELARAVGEAVGSQYPHKAAKIDAVVERTFRFEQINDKGAGQSR